MSTLSGSAKAGSESGLKVRLYAILSPVVIVLMERRNNCARKKKMVEVMFVAEEGFRLV